LKKRITETATNKNKAEKLNEKIMLDKKK